MTSMKEQVSGMEKVLADLGGGHAPAVPEHMKQYVDGKLNKLPAQEDPNKVGIESVKGQVSGMEKMHKAAIDGMDKIQMDQLKDDIEERDRRQMLPLQH